MTLQAMISKLNFRITGIISIILILFSILFCVILVPKLVRSQLRNNLMLKPNSEIRKMWMKAPFAVTFKVYVFNITNPVDVAKGKKPHVEQIGPYIFDEWKEKDIIEDDEKEDTVTFDMKNTFVFRPDLTKANSGLTGNEIVTIPHLLIMGGLIAVQRELLPLLNTAIKAMEQIFHSPTTPFLTARVMDILFNGVGIDCSSDEFEAVSFCTKLSDEKSINIINDTYLTFSILGGANATSIGRFKVSRGINDISKLGNVLAVNDEEEMDVWDGECNKIYGTDSTIFAPFHQKDDVLYAFAPDLCRSLGATYLHSSSYKSVPTGYYSMDFGDIKSDPNLHCFCRDQEVEKCPPKGTMDLFPCTKAPLLASKPQFLDADAKLVNDVDGLSPNRDEHDIFLHLEMLSSTPLSAAKRLQFAMDVEPVPDMKIMSNLRKVVIPLMWVEESAHLNSTYTGLFRKLYIVFGINAFLKYAFILCGLIGIALTANLLHNRNTNKSQVISTHVQQQQQQQSTSKEAAECKADITDVEQEVDAEEKERY